MWVKLYRRSTKGCLMCEDVMVSKLLIEGHPWTSSLLRIHFKVTVIKTKVLADFAHNIWEFPSSEWISFVMIPIHKGIILSRMTMEVTVELEMPCISNSFNEPLSMPDCWIDSLWWISPAAVQILARQWCSIITIYDTIGIKHRYYLKSEFL